MEAENKSRIRELRTLIRQHNVAYYESDSPSISDQEWDQMMRELKELEKRFPESYDP